MSDHTGGKIGHRLDKWLDECKMAISGIVLATREWPFLVAFFLSFIIFGTLMNLLSGSLAGVDLFWQVGFTAKLKILGDAFLMNFGIGKTFWDFIITFIITVLQSILIGLVVLVWHKKHRASSKLKNMNNVQDAGIAAGLAILGTGCPTCGTTLLAPLIGTIFSTGSFALANFISSALTIAAVIIVLFALKRIGKEAFVLIKSERFTKRHRKEPQDA